MALRYRWRNKVHYCLYLLIFLLLLTGCELSSSGATSSPARGEETVRIEPDLSGNAPNLTIDPLLPPGADIRPPKLGETGRDRSPEGLPIVGAMGIKADALFAEPIKDPDRRMQRLENAVVEIRRDLDAAMPAINRLVAIEGDIQELVTQLQSLLSQDSLSPVVNQPLAPAPIVPPPTTSPPTDQATSLINDLRAQEAATATPPASMPAPVAAPKTVRPMAKPILDGPRAKPAVKATQPTMMAKPQAVAASPESTTKSITPSTVRLGVHDDKVRLVIETDQPITITPDLDLNEKILLLDVQGADFSGTKLGTTPNDVVKSLETSSGQGGNRLIIELKRDTKVLKTATLPPGPGQPRYRTMVDLAK